MLELQWVFCIIPLEVFIIIMSYLLLKRTNNFFNENVHDIYVYRTLYAIKIITVKTVAGLALISSLAEIYPSLNTEADIAAYTCIVFGLIWIGIVLIYYQNISEYSKKLPIQIIQNVIMFLILITNLMLHIKYKLEVESYFLLILPMMANFLLNAIWTKVY